MNLAAVLKPFFRPPDLRPERQIESELDEEFAFHIEQIERELIEGDPAITHEEASRRARARFGDIETLKKRCKRIAMEERIMLQRINAVLMVVVMLAVVGVSVQVYVTQRYNTLALQEITMQLTNMRLVVAREGIAMEGTTVTSPAIGTASLRVLIEGTVERPGWYPITLDGATYLQEVVQAAGPLDPDHYLLRFREGEDRRRQLDSTTGIFRGSQRIAELLSDGARKVVLRPGDEIYVYMPEPSTMRRSADAAARQGNFYMSGNVLTKTGSFALPIVGELTLRGAITAAGGVMEDEAFHSDVLVLLYRSDGTLGFKGTLQELREGAVDPIIEPYDLVEVIAQSE